MHDMVAARTLIADNIYTLIVIRSVLATIYNIVTNAPSLVEVPIYSNLRKRCGYTRYLKATVAIERYKPNIAT
jgi:hypothetical protein